MIFGSHWPGNPGIRRNAQAMGALRRSVAPKEAIPGGDAARLLGLDTGEGRP